MNVANNHTHDYGDESYVDTLATLDVAGVYRFGNDFTNVLEVGGVKVGFTGIYECEVGLDCLGQAVDSVKALKEDGAQVIVCQFHWGDENATAPSDINIELAHAVIDAGADLVIGHHPHALQGIELYRGKYICYSMGSFCVGGNGSYKDKDTMIFQQTFSVKDGSLQEQPAYRIIPCSISTDSVRNTYCPTPAVGTEAERIMSKIYDLSAQLEGGITPEANDSEIPRTDSAKGA